SSCPTAAGPPIRAVLRGTYARAAYLLGSADEVGTERLRAALSQMVRGWDVEQVRRVVADTLTESIEPSVYAEAIALMDHHRQQGRQVVIASASGLDVVQPIADLLGADRVVATRMAVVDGRYTGELEFYAYAHAKAEAVAGLAHESGWDLAACYAYSDSVTDLPLLESVGHPAVVNPDRALRRLAADRGWEVLTFARPVALRPPVPRRHHTVAAALALALTGAVVLWWVRRGRVASTSPRPISRDAPSEV
ncbi:MAG TPA: HAD family hydrolase, partial [Actinotalea sp.]|nr:HAD family hydrolase [Actinotalea sp.]